MYKNGRNISGIYITNKSIKAIYKGGLLVWEAIRSCFGSGFWVNEKPWINDEGWRN